MDNKNLSVGVAIFTYNGAHFLSRTIPLLQASPLKPRVLVIDSSSKDGSAALAGNLGAEVIVITANEFNHGSTRELSRKKLATDIAVLMTQDAIPVDEGLLTKLVMPLKNRIASVAYARQIPHEGAGLLEAFPRRYNYPVVGEVRSIDDLGRLGAFTFFCSDSCAAWLNKDLDSIGGFEHTLTMEDTIATAKLLVKGHKIAYCADAVVKHSHCYSLRQEFVRSFDIGYVRSQHRELILSAGGDEKRGMGFFMALMRELMRSAPYLAPYAVVSIAVRYLGYRAGFHGYRLPVWVKRRFSGMPNYWNGG